MIMDKQLMFSDEQAIGDTEVSDNIIDLSGVAAKDGAEGVPLQVHCNVDVTFTDLTNMKISLYGDDDVAFGSAVLLWDTPVVVKATLAAGYVFKLPPVPWGNELRYLRLTYTVTGSTETAGKVTAGLVLEHQSNT